MYLQTCSILISESMKRFNWIKFCL